MSKCNVGQSLMFIYIHIFSDYKLFLYFNSCLSVMLDSLSCSFTSIFFITKYVHLYFYSLLIPTMNTSPVLIWMMLLFLSNQITIKCLFTCCVLCCPPLGVADRLLCLTLSVLRASIWTLTFSVIQSGMVNPMISAIITLALFL